MGFWEAKTEDYVFKASMNYTVRICFKIKKNEEGVRWFRGQRHLSHKPAGLNLVPRTHIKGRRKEPTP